MYRELEKRQLFRTDDLKVVVLSLWLLSLLSLFGATRICGVSAPLPPQVSSTVFDNSRRSTTTKICLESSPYAAPNCEDFKTGSVRLLFLSGPNKKKTPRSSSPPAMNEQADAFFAQYGPPSRQDWRQTTAGSAFIGLLVTIIAFLVYCGSVDPETSPYEQLTRLLAFTIRMISRLSGTIFRLQGSNMSGREGSALKTVFGLDSGSLRNISPTGTALRGLGSLLKSTTSEVPPGLGNMSNSCYQNSIIQVRRGES